MTSQHRHPVLLQHHHHHHLAVLFFFDSVIYFSSFVTTFFDFELENFPSFFEFPLPLFQHLPVPYRLSGVFEKGQSIWNICASKQTAFVLVRSFICSIHVPAFFCLTRDGNSHHTVLCSGGGGGDLLIELVTFVANVRRNNTLISLAYNGYYPCRQNGWRWWWWWPTPWLVMSGDTH